MEIRAGQDVSSADENPPGSMSRSSRATTSRVAAQRLMQRSFKSFADRTDHKPATANPRTVAALTLSRLATTIATTASTIATNPGSPPKPASSPTRYAITGHATSGMPHNRAAGAIGRHQFIVSRSGSLRLGDDGERRPLGNDLPGEGRTGRAAQLYHMVCADHAFVAGNQDRLEVPRARLKERFPFARDLFDQDFDPLAQSRHVLLAGELPHQRHQLIQPLARHLIADGPLGGHSGGRRTIAE